MFTIGHAHDVSFKVTVMGTSAEAQVRLVLACTPELSFPARKTSDGWTSTITIPTGISPCSCDLRVEAVINNRLFTPLTKKVELQALDVPVVQPEPTVVDASVDDTIDFVAQVPEVEQNQPAPDQPRISIIQMVADRDKMLEKAEVQMTAMPEMSALQKVVEAPPVVKPRIKEPVKQIEARQVEVKVKLTDITKMAEQLKPVKNTPTKKTKPMVELKSETPVKLIKGEIIYQ